MLSQKLIATDITPAHPQDRGISVMSLMDEFKVLHLPVVENGKLLGIVSEEDLWSMHNQEKPVKNILQRLKQAQVTFEHDVFEIVKLVNEHDLSLILWLIKVVIWVPLVFALYLKLWHLLLQCNQTAVY